MKFLEELFSACICMIYVHSTGLDVYQDFLDIKGCLGLQIKVRIFLLGSIHEFWLYTYLLIHMFT